MVIEGIATSLVIVSETHTAAEVTTVLGIEPTESHETGWSMRRGPVRHYSWWMLDAPIPDSEDEHNLASMSRMADLLEGKAAALGVLADRYEMRLTWGASSDSWQGGFVMPNELMAKLGPLGAAGVDLHGTIYLHETEGFWKRLRFAFGR